MAKLIHEMKCPKCKAEIEKPMLMHDQHGEYLRCPNCLVKLRLYSLPRVEPRSRPHMSKKERIRKRWKGKEQERFTKKGSST
jgi:DNA-directed RNA polymerase subunit RPC12/RpoP